MLQKIEIVKKTETQTKTQKTKTNPKCFDIWNEKQRHGKISQKKILEDCYENNRLSGHFKNKIACMGSCLQVDNPCVVMCKQYIGNPAVLNLK